MATRSTYEPTFIKRIFNNLTKALVRLGFKLNTTYVLSVPGRRTGKTRSVPVTLVEEDGKRWLVAPYGDVEWVKNARAAGKVGLTRGKHSEIETISELGAEEAVPVLKMYVERVPVPRSHFDNGPDAPAEAFITEADRHPVFLLG